MTTANTLIADALAEIGVLSDGQTASSADAALALRRLNQIMQRWANFRLLSPSLTEVSVPLTGAQSYVIADKPVRVQSAKFVDATGLESPAEVVNAQTWDGIAQKDVAGAPELVWYEAGTGAVYVYPKASGYTLKMDCQVVLATFEASTPVDLPAGYESALMLTLACDLCRPFGRQVPADLKQAAAAAVRAVKRTNTETMLLSIDLAEQQQYQIERGY